MKKDSNWEPEPDDQDFELESEYFLTGIGDGSPDEAPLENIMPIRHTIDSVIIANCLYGVSPAYVFHEAQLGLTLLEQG